MEIFQSILIGISIAAIPGPVFFELVRRTLTNGFLSGSLINAGQFFANVVVLSLTFFGAGLFLTSDILKMILYLVGGLVILWLGSSALRLKRKDIEEGYKKKITNGNSFFVGFNLGAANPIVIALWISLSGSYLMQFSSKYLAFLNIILIAFGFVVFFFILATIIHYTRHKISPEYVILLSKIFGLILIFYGGLFIYKLISVL